MHIHSARLVALLTLIGISGVAPAHAAGIDAETITSCMKAEQNAGRQARSCIGRVSDPCMKQPGGETTVGMVQCLDRETKVWDAILNEEYKTLLGSVDSKTAAAIRTAQRSWIKTRDADCGVPYSMFEGGTIARPMSIECMMEETAERTLRLRAWRQMADPN